MTVGLSCMWLMTVLKIIHLGLNILFCYE